MNLTNIEKFESYDKEAFDRFKLANEQRINHWLNEHPHRQLPIWRDPETKEFKWLNRQERKRLGI